MTNLSFYDTLRDHPFVSNNNYAYVNIQDSNLRFFKDCQNYPYIMTSPWQQDPTVLRYPHNAFQLRGRLLNTVRIKEVMDSAGMPLMFKIREKHYLIGKGFLAHVTNQNEFTDSLNMLFVACMDMSKPVEGIEDIRFFVSRDIYKEDYKAVSVAIKDIMLAHPGDVVLTSNIGLRIGDKIPFPRGGTIASRQKYKESVMLECLQDYFA